MIPPHAVPPGALPASAPFLAADVGGTHARIALVREAADGTIDVLHQHEYTCADYAGFAEIVADFLRRPDVPTVHEAAIGCTGMRRGDLVISNNLPWAIALADLRALGLTGLAVVNDFVAVAHAVQCMDATSPGLFGTFAGDALPGPTLVFGPGTGLGAALRVPHGDDTLVLPSEVGQAAFAPGNAREAAVLDVMHAQAAHVANDRLVSGPGLTLLHAALCVLEHHQTAHRTPAAIVDAAQSGHDPLATETVKIFCDAMGAILGDTVLTTGATGVFVAGGIVPKIRSMLDRSDFLARFLGKGAMRPALERVPVRLMEHPQRGTIGAATWYLRQRAAQARTGDPVASPHAFPPVL